MERVREREKEVNIYYMANRHTVQWTSWEKDQKDCKIQGIDRFCVTVSSVYDREVTPIKPEQLASYQEVKNDNTNWHANINAGNFMVPNCRWKPWTINAFWERKN